MGAPNASYAITLRLQVAAEDPTAIGRVTTAIGETGGAVAAMDFVETAQDPMTPGV